MLPSILFAQIGPIQTQEKQYEFVVGNMLYRKVATDTYYCKLRATTNSRIRQLSSNSAMDQQKR